MNILKDKHHLTRPILTIITVRTNPAVDGRNQRIVFAVIVTVVVRTRIRMDEPRQLPLAQRVHLILRPRRFDDVEVVGHGDDGSYSNCPLQTRQRH